MQVIIEESASLRRASASLREGDVVLIKLPRRWSASLKQSITQQLLEKIQNQLFQEKKILNQIGEVPRISLMDEEALTTFVREVNQQTFQVELGAVKIGQAKYSHLAQLNVKSKTMTVSSYCLYQVPVPALRYLIIHELAHYFERGHGKAFWERVARHVPDYRLQSRIIKAFHHQQVIGEHYTC
jgi:predicted metal-dependent hydrolase